MNDIGFYNRRRVKAFNYNNDVLLVKDLSDRKDFIDYVNRVNDIINVLSVRAYKFKARTIYNILAGVSDALTNIKCERELMGE